jgi:spore photoproduct lyase
MNKVKSVNRKTELIRTSGRSSDFIAPSFGYGCLFDCTYCYMKRHKPEGLDYATNIGSILTAISNHAWFTEVEKPNQTHPEYITYDISCNEDFALHAKYYDWKRIFQFFVDHPVAMGTLATKYVNKNLLEFNPNYKIRIRFSLMPEKLRQKLEPNTSTIQERLDAVVKFQSAGYDVHLNFSPVVVYDEWLDDYKELFEQVQSTMQRDMWNYTAVKAEVIFLTHNENKHQYNTEWKKPGENLLWTPNIQEPKESEFGGKNIRYKRNMKRDFVNKFMELHSEIIPWNIIRYIF